MTPRSDSTTTGAIGIYEVVVKQPGGEVRFIMHGPSADAVRRVVSGRYVGQVVVTEVEPPHPAPITP